MDTQLCRGVSRVENIPWSWAGQPELHLRQDISRDRTPHGERPSRGDKMLHGNRNLFGERTCIQVRITPGDRMFLRHRNSVWDRVVFGNRTPIHDRTSLGDRIPCSRIRMPLWDKSPTKGRMSTWDRNPLKDRQDALRGPARCFAARAAARTLRSPQYLLLNPPLNTQHTSVYE